jgi:hypothetical protein
MLLELDESDSTIGLSFTIAKRTKTYTDGQLQKWVDTLMSAPFGAIDPLRLRVRSEAHPPFTSLARTTFELHRAVARSSSRK